MENTEEFVDVKLHQIPKTDSPWKIADKVIGSGSSEIRNNFIVGAALSLQFKENSAKSHSQQEKMLIARNIFGPIISKAMLDKEKILLSIASK